jgi:hypothetical protein
MNREQISSIEDRFVDAVKSALGSGPDWSTDPVILYRRTVESDIETAGFADSSYMTRAAYNLRANELRITLEKRRNSEGRTDPCRLLGQAAGCSVQGEVLSQLHSAAA